MNASRRGIIMCGVVAAVLNGFTAAAMALTPTQQQAIVRAARSKLELPYKYGATDITKSTDCSLLTQWCYKQAGISIGRTSRVQYRGCNRSSNEPGSLIFFATDPNRPGQVTHVGINLGNGKMIDANSDRGKVVEEDWANSRYWRSCFIASGTP